MAELPRIVQLKLLFLTFIYFERETIKEKGRGRDREGERASEAGPRLSVQRQMWG